MKQDYDKHKYYVVKKGRNEGIYEKWKDCLKQIEGILDAKFQGFDKLDDAKEYLDPFFKKDLGQKTIDEFFKRKSI